MARKKPPVEQYPPSQPEDPAPKKPRPTKPKPGKKPKTELVRLSSHRDLISQQKTLFSRINADPNLSRLFVLNPVLAFQELGVEMTPAIAHHVLHTIQHPTQMRSRRDELEARLKEALGEPAQPQDGKWVSEVLFERWKLTPVEIGDQQPAYLPPMNEPALERLQKMRPPSRQRYQKTSFSGQGGAVGLERWKSTLRRMNLDAELPKLKPGKKIPASVDLETLYFYKDSHPLARDLLELGIIQRRGWPIHSADSVRKIKAGEKSNLFYRWVKSVRFPEEAPE